MKLFLYILLFSSILSTSVYAQSVQKAENEVETKGIVFMHDDFDGAIAKAKKENKLVFIDFFAVWCGPCKMMSKMVFTDSILGEYFSEHYVAVKLNTELPKNKAIVEKYKVVSMPSLVFLDTAGNIIGRNNGSADIKDFLNMSKVAAGDMIGFEEWYKRYKASPDDLKLMQKVLQTAPAFVTSKEGMDKKKWILRIEKVYKVYVEKKMGPDFINKTDYRIVQRYNKPTTMNDEVIDFMVKNMDSYKKKVGKAAAFYVIEYNDQISQDLAKKGDLKYKDAIERIKGDYSTAYDVGAVRKLSAYEISKANCDALYAIWKEVNIDQFIQIKQDYFKAMDGTENSMEQAAAAQNMLYAASKKMNNDQKKVARGWLIGSLKHNDIPLLERINIVVVLGDVNRDLKLLDEAKKAYNEAYAETLQLKEEQMKMYMQMNIKRKLELLKLE